MKCINLLLKTILFQTIGKIVGISCGKDHCGAWNEDGEVFTWGESKGKVFEAIISFKNNFIRWETWALNANRK